MDPVYKPRSQASYISPKHKLVSHVPTIFRTAPEHKSAPSYPQPFYHNPTKAVDSGDNVSYKFSYGVVDAYANLNYGENEERNGALTTGEYRVLLPDCRTQIVKYHTDNQYSGNIMEVTYEGEPC